MYNNSVPTSQETHYISAAEPNHFVLYSEMSLCIDRTIWKGGQEILFTYSNHFVLKC
jgi:hypothetical protein